MSDVFSSDLYVTVTSIPATGSNGISFAFWMRANSTDISSNVFDFGNGAANNNIIFGISKGYIYVNVYSSTTSNLLENFYSLYVNDNKWRHYAWVIQSNGTYQFYINNVLQYSTTSGNSYPVSVIRTSNYIGKSNTTYPYFNGGIDDFRIYNRSLTSTEISDIYTNAPLNIYTIYGITGVTGPTGTTGFTGPAGPAGQGSNSYNVVNTFIDASFCQNWDILDITNGLPYGTGFTYMTMSDSGSSSIGVVNGGYVYITTNTGTTWSIPSGLSFSSSWQYCTCTSDFTKLAICDISSVYVSINSGTSWTRVDVSNVELASTITFVKYTKDGSILYASGQNGLYKSTNNGTTFVRANNIGLYPALSNNIAISNDNQIILLEAKINNFTPIYISRDGGEDWTQIMTLPQNAININSYWSIAISGSGKVMVVSQSTMTYISYDYGFTWNNISGIYGIPLISSDGTKIIIYSSSAVYISLDSGGTWNNQAGIGGLLNALSYSFISMSVEVRIVMVSASSTMFLCNGALYEQIIYSVGITGSTGG